MRLCEIFPVGVIDTSQPSLITISYFIHYTLILEFDYWLQLPDKSISSLVKYYYSWKKTRSRTSLMDRQARKLANRNNPDERSLIHLIFELIYELIQVLSVSVFAFDIIVRKRWKTPTPLRPTTVITTRRKRRRRRYSDYFKYSEAC